MSAKRQQRPLRRRVALSQGAPLRRTPLRRPKPPERASGVQRDWSFARAKCEREAKCRVCGERPVEAAHTIGRAYDIREGANKTIVVDPDDIVPLCTVCHVNYDARRLDLLPYLEHGEQAAAVRIVGIERARARLSGGR